MTDEIWENFSSRLIRLDEFIKFKIKHSETSDKSIEITILYNGGIKYGRILHRFEFTHDGILLVTHKASTEAGINVEEQYTCGPKYGLGIHNVKYNSFERNGYRGMMPDRFEIANKTRLFDDECLIDFDKLFIEIDKMMVEMV